MMIIFRSLFLIRAIINLQKTRVKAVLATIIRTEGSAPRDRGSQMLIMENGQTIGTIGGGTGENLIVNRAGALFVLFNGWKAYLFNEEFASIFAKLKRKRIGKR